MLYEKAHAGWGVGGAALGHKWGTEVEDDQVAVVSGGLVGLLCLELHQQEQFVVQLKYAVSVGGKGGM